MAKKADRIALSRINMVARGTVLEGTLHAGGDLLVRGHIIGAVTVAARLVVAPGGIIDGDVIAADADVSGAVHGALDVDGALVLRQDAQVAGDVTTGRLVVEEGAQFSGTCTMLSVAAQPREAAQSPAPLRRAEALSKWAMALPKRLKTSEPKPAPSPVEAPPDPVEALPHWAEALSPSLDLPPAEASYPEPDGEPEPVEPPALPEALAAPPSPVIEEPTEAEALPASSSWPVAASLKRFTDMLRRFFAASPSAAALSTEPASVAEVPEPVEVPPPVVEAPAEPSAPEEPAPAEGEAEDRLAAAKQAAEPTQGAAPRRARDDKPARTLARKVQDAGKRTGVAVLGLLLGTALIAGAYWGIDAMRKNAGSTATQAEPGGALTEAQQASIAADAPALPAPEASQEPPEETPSDDEDEDTRQAALQDQSAATLVRLGVVGRSAEPEGAALFQQAETARLDAQRHLDAGRFEAASGSFREARALYEQMRQALDDKDRTRDAETVAEIAEEDPVEVVEEDAAEVAEEDAPDREEADPAVAEAEEEQARTLEEVEAVVRRLARQVKTHIEREDIASMQALFHRGWGPFFDEAAQIAAVVRPGTVQLNDTQATVDVALDLTYEDAENQPQQRTRSYVWTLTRLSDGWVLMKVSAR